MNFKNITRRRGTSIAAAALSLALVAPAVQPVVNPSAVPAAFAQATPSTHPELQGAGGAIDADAIAAGVVTSATDFTNATSKNGINGRFFRAVGGTASSVDPTSTNDAPMPDGSVIYAQWKDKDGWVSPVYKAKTHNIPGAKGSGGEGSYAFQFPTVIDAYGNERTFTPTVGSQAYKVWAESDVMSHDPAQPEDTNNSMYVVNSGPSMSTKWIPDSYARGSFQFTGINIQRVGVWYYEAPGNFQNGSDVDSSNYMKSKTNLVEDPNGWDSGLPGDDWVRGRVYYEPHDLWGDPLPGAPNATGNQSATKYKVFLSTLTPEGETAVKSQVNNLPVAERAAATKKLLEANPDYIAQTVWAKTDDDGRYMIRARRAADGSLDDSLPELNRGLMYMWIEDENGQVQPAWSNFISPYFQGFNHSPHWSPVATTGAGSSPSPLQSRSATGMNFAVLPFSPVQLTITNANDTDNPASPGEEIRLRLDGDMPRTPSKIEWRDSSGNVLHTCDSVNAVADAADCTYKLPEDAPEGIYTAVLVSEGQDVAQDSFAVKDPKNQHSEFDPEYEGTTAPKGEETTVPAPKNKQADEDGNFPELPEGTKFTQPKHSNDETPQTDVIDPNGKSVDFPGDFTINPDGSIAVTPNTDAPNGEYKIPVVVEYPDGSKETIYAPIKVVEKFTEPKDNGQSGQADEITPSWENSKTPAGEPVKVPNTGEEIPEGSTVEAVSDKGWTVDSTPEGEITVTPPDGAKTGDKSTIWVTVTYPDGSQDVEKFTVTVQNDDDGDGDPTNDGSDADKTTPDWANAETKPEKPVDIPNTGDKLPEGSEVKVPATVEDQSGNDWTVEKVGDNGDIKVTPPEGAKPGDKVEVEIEVTYPDGSTDKETVTVTVVGDYDVEYEDGKGKVDTDIEAKPVPAEGTTEIPEGTKYATAKDDDGQPNQETHDGLWTIEDPDENGVVVAKVDSKKLKERYDSEHNGIIGDKCTTGEEITEQEAKDLIEKLKPLFSANSVVDVTFPNSDEDEATANFTLLDANGNPMAESDDWDGDGVSNIEEIQKCSDPFDPDSKPTAPVEKPDWDDASTTPNKPVEIPKKDGSGDVPEGSTVDVTEGPGTAEIGEDGTITVTPSEDAKPGDKIVVEVKDPEGNVIDTVTVEIEQPAKKPISSSEREGCTESLIGFGLPLLALIPLGIASQVAIPGLENIQAQVGRQIQDANTALQNQLGIMDPRLAKAAADFQAQLRGAGANLNQVLGGLAVLAYGIAAITTIATKCGPGNTNTQTDVEVSSIFGKGSSSKSDGDKGSSSKGSSKGKDENNGSSSQPEGDKGSSSSSAEGNDGSSQGSGADAEAPAEGSGEGSSAEENAGQ